jgi:flotillin
VQKKALIAEARAKAESAVQAASNRRETELSKIDAAISTARADNAKRLADAQSRSAALVAEAQGQVASQQARAEGDLEVQKARVEQVRRQLAADVLEPARARKAAAEANAKGDAAQIIEQGRATAAAMTEIAATWREVGPAARSVFLMQKVADLTRIVMSTVKTLKVERLTILGGLGGAGAGTAGNGAGSSIPDLTGRLIAAREQIRAATGIDLAAALRGPTKPPTPPDAGR